MNLQKATLRTDVSSSCEDRRLRFEAVQERGPFGSFDTSCQQNACGQAH